MSLGRLSAKGFTLAEMLIMLLVLGVLLSITAYLAAPLLEHTLALSDDAELDQVQKGMWLPPNSILALWEGVIRAVGAPTPGMRLAT